MIRQKIVLFAGIAVSLMMPYILEGQQRQPQGTKQPQPGNADVPAQRDQPGEQISSFNPLFPTAVDDPDVKQSIVLYGNGLTDDISVYGPDGNKVDVTVTGAGSTSKRLSLSLQQSGNYRVVVSVSPPGRSIESAFEVKGPSCDLDQLDTIPGPSLPIPAQSTDRCGVIVREDETTVLFDAQTKDWCIAMPQKGRARATVKDCSSPLGPMSAGRVNLPKSHRVRIYVAKKNPFLRTYKLDANAETILDDDISTFLGILVPTLGGGQAASAASKNATSSQKALGVAPGNASSEIATPANCSSAIAERLVRREAEYASFLQEYAQLKIGLEDINAACSDLFDTAKKLWNRATSEFSNATDLTLGNAVQQTISSVDEMLGEAQSIAQPDAFLKRQIAALTVTRKQLVQESCINSKLHQLYVSELQQKIISPLEDVFKDQDSFRSTTVRGPFIEATSLHLVPKYKDLPAAPMPSFDPVSVYSSCFADTQQSGQQPDAPAKPPKAAISPGFIGASLLEVAFPIAGVSSQSGNPTPNDGAKTTPPTKKPGANPAPAPNTPATPGDNSDTGYISETDQTVQLGGPRFIVSAGVTLALLRNQEFQKGIGQAVDSKGNPISGQETATIITYSTNSSKRVSPIALLNTRLMGIGHTGEGLYVTTGVTAKSYAQGISPEYLLGLTPSFGKQHVFLTIGGYVGIRQRLTNGLFVGEQLPSGFSGNIPVQQQYKIGLSFALSYRIPKLSSK